MTAASIENSERPTMKPWVPGLSITLTGISVAIYVAIHFSGQGFDDLFRGFGADLPALTAFVLAYYKYFGVLALIGLVPCVLLLWNRTLSIEDSHRLFALVLMSFGLSLAVLVLFAAAMYLPVFKLGSVVQ